MKSQSELGLGGRKKEGGRWEEGNCKRGGRGKGNEEGGGEGKVGGEGEGEEGRRGEGGVEEGGMVGGGGCGEEGARRKREGEGSEKTLVERRKVKSHVKSNFKNAKGAKISLKVADKKTSFQKIQKITLFPKVLTHQKDEGGERSEEGGGRMIEGVIKLRQVKKTDEKVEGGWEEERRREKGGKEEGTKEKGGKEEERREGSSREEGTIKVGRKEEGRREEGGIREERGGEDGSRREGSGRREEGWCDGREKVGSSGYIRRISKEFLNTIKGEEKYLDIFVEMCSEPKKMTYSQ